MNKSYQEILRMNLDRDLIESFDKNTTQEVEMDKNMTTAEKVGVVVGGAGAFVAGGPAAAPIGAGAGYAAGRAWDSWQSDDSDSGRDD